MSWQHLQMRACKQAHKEKNRGKLLCCPFCYFQLEQAEFLNQETVVEVTEPTPHHDVDSLPQLAANQFLSENADLGSPPQSLNPSIADGLQRERQKPCKIQPTLGCWVQWHWWFCLFPEQLLKIKQHKLQVQARRSWLQ